ncbi:hypothetical protein B0J13DRAFT_601359 [Dactylonectria estremocensis]|uniref:Uncharacterized protein n=1 Tax=Dactylonectria estremocensis TaxID=1079267 RepID=A0A9P9FJQ3_9HYPO|nr:hypothetical protein B0J13DRAFT_601359 [Dactylonectria estremocensis]
MASQPGPVWSVGRHVLRTQYPIAPPVIIGNSSCTNFRRCRISIMVGSYYPRPPKQPTYARLWNLSRFEHGAPTHPHLPSPSPTPMHALEEIVTCPMPKPSRQNFKRHQYRRRLTPLHPYRHCSGTGRPGPLSSRCVSTRFRVIAPRSKLDERATTLEHFLPSEIPCHATFFPIDPVTDNDDHQRTMQAIVADHLIISLYLCCSQAFAT